MKSSRRGFFVTLAAMPAVVMGRKAITAPGAPDWYPRNLSPRKVPVWGATFTADPMTGERVVHRFEDGKRVERYSGAVTGP